MKKMKFFMFIFVLLVLPMVTINFVKGQIFPPPIGFDSCADELICGSDGNWYYDSCAFDAAGVESVPYEVCSSPSEGGDGSGQVTLTLTEGQNSCTLQDYNLGAHAVSQLDQNVQSSGQAIVCEFLENSRSVVSISMGDLLDGEKEIGASNFTGIITQGTYLGSIGNLTGGSYNLSGTHQIYEKEVNTIGTWTGELQIEGIIPAGTPSGTYTGSLEIIIQEGM